VAAKARSENITAVVIIREIEHLATATASDAESSNNLI
jgi:hypothetical protein